MITQERHGAILQWLSTRSWATRIKDIVIHMNTQLEKEVGEHAKKHTNNWAVARLEEIRAYGGIDSPNPIDTKSWVQLNAAGKQMAYDLPKERDGNNPA